MAERKECSTPVGIFGVCTAGFPTCFPRKGYLVLFQVLAAGARKTFTCGDYLSGRVAPSLAIGKSLRISQALFGLSKNGNIVTRTRLGDFSALPSPALSHP